MGENEISYVAVGADEEVAYRVFGDGPIDVLCFYGLGSHLELLSDFPMSSSPARLFSSFGRAIEFDRRGTGASGGARGGSTPTWEEWAEDLCAVLDAVGSERAAIYAEIDAGPMALLFAATHPERVRSLALVNTSARYLIDDDYPIGVSREDCDALIETLVALWGTAELVETVFPSIAHDPELVRLYARMFRAAASPRTVAAQYRYILESLDVRAALPLIRVPTLVLHNESNLLVPITHARFIADHIDGATLIELPSEGDLNIMGGDEVRRAVDEVADFLIGERPFVDSDRVLATVLFTDIVGSTELVASLGDSRWRQMLDTHDRMVRDHLRRFRGREIKTTGDGFFAAFDGPARAIRCAKAIVESGPNVGVSLRAGLHTGECEIRGDDLGGLAVHVAARVGAFAGSGECLVTSTVRDLVAGSGISFDDRGFHPLKGVPDERHLFAITRT
jgi:class 3 adenylate cyclase